jgi:release factor glutamine methyltransferase
LEFAVDSRVLIPRPETEPLAERGWLFLQERAGPGGQAVGALDFGTGSGCLAVVLAAKCPAAEVVALDISAEALELARQNAVAHGVGERLRFLQGDGLPAIPGDSRFDLVISNPPYIRSDEISSLQPEVRDFDPRLALDGGPGGLDFYSRLAAQGARYLKPGGKIMLEFGDDQAPSLREIFARENWIVEAVVEDYTQRPRIFIARANI